MGKSANKHIMGLMEYIAQKIKPCGENNVGDDAEPGTHKCVNELHILGCSGCEITHRAVI